jgi:hypothetical protein
MKEKTTMLMKEQWRHERQVRLSVYGTHTSRSTVAT